MTYKNIKTVFFRVVLKKSISALYIITKTRKSCIIQMLCGFYYTSIIVFRGIFWAKPHRLQNL